MSHLKWIAQPGNEIGATFRKPLFDHSMTPTNWDSCALVCCEEIRLMSDRIVKMMGHVPGRACADFFGDHTFLDVSANTLCVPRQTVITMAQRIQHK